MSKSELVLDRAVCNAAPGGTDTSSSDGVRTLSVCLALERALMGNCVRSSHPPFKKDIGKLKQVQRRAMRTIRKLENNYYGQKILNLGASLYLIEWKLKGELWAIHKSQLGRKALVMVLCCHLEARKMGLETRQRI